MSEKKPIPRSSGPGGQVCPICGKQTYSLGGIHPQCAVHQADAVRSAKLKTERKRESTTVVKQPMWTKKKCPKCGCEVHVRLKTCVCGYAFS